MVADIQALTDNADDPEKVRKNVLEVVLDNLAAGVSPEKTTFFVQSQISEIAELTVLFLNLVALSRLKRNPTVKEEMRQKKFGENVPVGFLAYPVSQAADILVCNSNIIPVGEDQLPVIEQANEIVVKFNSIYGKTFRRIKPILSASPRLVGIDGRAKASKSLGNSIYLDDSLGEIEKKVMSMYTDSMHIHEDDPGKIEENVVFAYLDVFDPDKVRVERLKQQYRQGGLGDVVIKKHLISVLENVISPIRDRRRKLAENPAYIAQLLKEGTEKARGIARETMGRVRRATRINYFER
jgi:tryptophanyl-tRNA synthetase